jgi:hypothetical protein
MSKRLHHDVAHAASLDLLDMFRWSGPAERADAYELFYRALRAALDGYDNLALREYQRLNPLQERRSALPEEPSDN